MKPGTFVLVIVGVLVAAVVLVWTFVSAAALVYSLVEEGGRSAGVYAVCTLAGVAVIGAAGWVAWRRSRGAGRAVVSHGPERH